MHFNFRALVIFVVSVALCKIFSLNIENANVNMAIENANRKTYFILMFAIFVTIFKKFTDEMCMNLNLAYIMFID